MLNQTEKPVAKELISDGVSYLIEHKRIVCEDERIFLNHHYMRQKLA
ncbi:MAG: hypothetical protein L6U99_14960 [Clostridium sp.]|nr:MAG: hypothetical protein L6U99_14960 [Clostridium sp.]